MLAAVLMKIQLLWLFRVLTDVSERLVAASSITDTKHLMTFEQLNYVPRDNNTKYSSIVWADFRDLCGFKLGAPV
jgi:hypothetical protein